MAVRHSALPRARAPRSHRWALRTALGLALLPGAAGLSAQEKPGPTGSAAAETLRSGARDASLAALWRWSTFTTREGLPSDVIEQVVETDDGTSWVATGDGVAWYDGYDWHRVGPEEGLTVERVAQLVPLPRDAVLARAAGRLFRGDRGGFRELPVRDGDGRPVRVDDAVPLDGDTLLVVSGTDLFRGPPEALVGVEPPAPLPTDPPVSRLWRTRRSVWINTAHGLFEWVEGEWIRRFGADGSIVQVDVLAEGAAGIGVAAVSFPIRHRGVWVWSGDGDPRFTQEEVGSFVLALDVAPDGSVWVAHEGGVIRTLRDGAWSTLASLPSVVRDPSFLRFRENGDLWVGTPSGLYLHRALDRLWTRIDFPAPDLRNRVNELMRARDGVLWIGTAGGLVVRDTRGDLRSVGSEEMGFREVTGLGEDPSGAIWASSGSQPGLARRSQGGWTRLGGASAPSMPVHRIHRDRSGRLWFLGLADRHPPAQPPVWVLEDGTPRPWGPALGLPASRVYAMDDGADGSLWFGTLGGISRWRDGTWTHWGAGDGLRAAKITSLTVGPDGAVWFGDRRNGLGRLDGGSLTYVTTADGLVHDQVWDIRRGVDDGIWVATQGGLGRRADGSWGTFRGGPASFHLWPVLPLEDEVVVGTLGAGVSVLDLEAAGRRTPRIVLRDPTIRGRSVRLSWQVRSPWGHPRPTGVETRYRLDGGPWSAWAATRELWLEDVAPGEHRVEVQAKDFLGEPVTPLATAGFDIPLPFYRRLEYVLPLAALTALVVALLALLVQRRRAYERSLREREEQYRSFFEHDLTGDLVVDVQGRILACNPALVKMLDFPSRDAALGLRICDFFEDPGEAGVLLGILREGGRIERREIRLRTTEDRPVHAIFNVNAVERDGELVEARAYLFDDTDRKRLEEQLRQSQKMEAVGRLAGGVAHDFNNLLTAINGYAELMLDNLPEEDPRRSDVLQIHRAGLRGKELTAQLLAFGRRQLLEIRAVDVNEVVREMEGLIRRTVGTDLRVETRLDSNLPAVKTDPNRLEQVILNLVVNARDALDRPGRIGLHTWAVRLSEEDARRHDGARAGEYVVLEVEDDGSGIDAATMERIFEPFFTTKAKGKGTGLGLSMVYGLVRQSGGFVEVRSHPGQGSRFRVHLPVTRSRPRSAAPRPVEPRRAREPVRVLLVEDEDVVRRLAERVLEGAGYAVVSAADAMAALAMMDDPTHADVRLVVTDVVMPGMSGPFMVDELRSRGIRVPVLFMSGFAESLLDRYGSLEGGMTFLAKPFGPNELLAAVRRTLDRSTTDGPVRGPRQPVEAPSTGAEA